MSGWRLERRADGSFEAVRDVEVETGGAVTVTTVERLIYASTHTLRERRALAATTREEAERELAGIVRREERRRAHGL